MSEEQKDEIDIVRGIELLDIFISEEDIHGHNIFAMSNFFDIYISRLSSDINARMTTESVGDVAGMIGQITTFFKGVVDIKNSSWFVADLSHFSPEIVEKLNEGIYTIGKSKQIAGNLRPVVLDESNNIVKEITLRQYGDPSKVLSDISTLSMQISLRQISKQIEDVSKDVKYSVEFARRNELQTPFFNARETLMEISGSRMNEEVTLLVKKANEYLREGLNALYSDIDSEFVNLAKLKDIHTVKLKDVDRYLNHITEDMNIIPQYVGLRAHLFNYLGEHENTERVMGEFKHKLNDWLANSVEDSKYTALQLLHMYYPYQKDNLNFWIKKPQEICRYLDNIETVSSLRRKSVYQISMEENYGQEE